MITTILTIVLLMGSSLINICELVDQGIEIDDNIPMGSDIDKILKEIKNDIKAIKKDIYGIETDIKKIQKDTDGLKSNAVLKDKKGRIPSALLPDSTVQTVKGRIPSSLLPGSAVLKDNKGKIPQPLLPGYYGKYSLADVMWGSVHNAAAAACHKYGTIYGTVIAATPNATCAETCEKTNETKLCGGIIRFKGTMEHATMDKSEVGAYTNRYDCKTRVKSESERSQSDGYIIPGYKVALHYCCCAVKL